MKDSLASEMRFAYTSLAVISKTSKISCKKRYSTPSMVKGVSDGRGVTIGASIATGWALVDGCIIKAWLSSSSCCSGSKVCTAPHQERKCRMAWE